MTLPSYVLLTTATSQQVQTEHKRRRLTLPSIAELTNLSRKLSIFRDQSFNHSANSAPGVEFPSFSKDDQEVTVLKVGVLFKKSLGCEEDSRPGPTRQRRFRLTEGALEYMHHFSQVSTCSQGRISGIRFALSRQWDGYPLGLGLIVKDEFLCKYCWIFSYIFL